ncbi:hypothetical protein [Nocardia sp. NPDC006630]|uniref:hypothetical protein n=1 Tax=Nocardia sp. NPDC006630 TaxID=3157181 RepID=UPI00339E5345
MGAVSGEVGPRYRFAIERATLDDVPGIVNVLMDASRWTYRHLPVDPEKAGVRGLLGDWAARKPHEYETLIRAGSDNIFVHRLESGRIAGYIHATAAAECVAWHIGDEFHGTGLAGSLLRRMLEEAGDSEIRTQTTRFGKPYSTFLRFGFRPEGDLTETPPPMATVGIDAVQQRLRLSRQARRDLLSGRLADA